jgi:RNA polymerase sigma-70 factor (ECF subfamily)
MAQLEFDTWYRTERPKVVASIAAITARPSIAAEAADEAFTRAVERWARVEAMTSPGGWVTRTALNVARRKLRREGQEGRLWRRATAEVPVEAPPPMWPSDLWAALDALTPREREAMVLRHVADLSTKDVATVMGVSQGTVSSTLHSARARLVAELAKEVTDV